MQGSACRRFLIKNCARAYSRTTNDWSKILPIPFDFDSPHGTSAALFDAKGELTALGRCYRSVTSETPDSDQTFKPDPNRSSVLTDHGP